MIGNDTRPFNAQHGPIYGDLSRQDTVVLAHFVRQATSIVEAGVGGSTYTIHSNVNNAAHPIMHFETDNQWREKVIRMLPQVCPNTHPHQFLLIPEDQPACRVHMRDLFAREGRLYDLVFLDAIYYYREIIGQAIWPHVAIGGHVLIHDTRQQDARQFLFPFIDEHFNEIEEVKPNFMYSNITVIKKTVKRDYENWNHTEADNNRKGWNY